MSLFRHRMLKHVNAQRNEEAWMCLMSHGKNQMWWISVCLICNLLRNRKEHVNKQNSFFMTIINLYLRNIYGDLIEERENMIK